MMVNRSHAKDALAPGDLEISHLQYHGEGFHHKEPAQDGQNKLLFAENGQKAQSAAQAQAPHVAHENLGRIGIEP